MERCVYRIIDANFNRAREAARIIEEYCRFALNSEPFTKSCKQLRHRLSACISSLGDSRLIAGRDTAGDVGIGAEVDSQLKRTNLESCFVAGCKRLTEALRILAEAAATLNPEISKELESLRYQAYGLEKDITLFSSASKRFENVRLYIVLSKNFPVDIISLTRKCIAGGADCLQLRAKDIADDQLFSVAVEFVKICKANNVISVINDRADIAVACGADGVHLGQNDIPVDQTRKLALSPLIIGKSTHSTEQLKRTCLENPVYVGLGPVFPTPTKPTAGFVGLGYVKSAVDFLKTNGIRGVAIGGINPGNIEEVLKTGVGTIAVCSAVTEAKDPEKACRLLKEKIASFS